MRVLVTGTAGFIGFHVSRRLIERGDTIVGVDNLSAYYDPRLKQARLDQLLRLPGFAFHALDITDRPAMAHLFAAEGCSAVIHLAAQAGVRHSIEAPHDYADTNLVGFLNVLEGCRQGAIDHLVYASSSSVYGLNTTLPFSEHQGVDHPVSLYAATKRANELMAHAYSHLYRLPTTGLRFFTVYGPWGRPDMALFEFTRRILAGEPIRVYNHGHMLRDFTYIDDIVEGVVRALDHPPSGNPGWDGSRPDPATSTAPYRLYNIGNEEPVELIDFIRLIEAATGRTAILDLQPMQPGDVQATAADLSDLNRDTGFTPVTPIAVGIGRFVDWYREHFALS